MADDSDTDDSEPDDSATIAAGDFSTWLRDIGAAIRGERASDVPCAGCTACCTASQFVHIEPDETDTLAHIPKPLRFPAPRLPRGHVLLGYDEHGHCPMLVAGGCSIYEHRPRTCRTYDCRVFAAAGLEVEEAEKTLINARVRRWRFSHPTDADRVEHAAVRAAATFLHEHAAELPDAMRPATSTQHAVLAVDIHAVFLERNRATGALEPAEPSANDVRVELTRRRRR